MGHSWRSKDELISDVLPWSPSYGRAKAGRPARTYIQQLCADTGCNTEDMPEAMVDRKGWWERINDILADGATWLWCYLTRIILFDTSFIYRLLNGSFYCYLITIIQFQHTVKRFQVLLFNPNNFIQHNSFVCTQLNGSNYCSVKLTIQFNFIYSFAYR